MPGTSADGNGWGSRAWAAKLVDRLQAVASPPAPVDAAPVQLRLFPLPPAVSRPVAEHREPLVSSRNARLAAIGVVVAYIVLFSYWTTKNHDGFGTQAFDFGIYDQGLWLLSHFQRPFVTVMGRHLFGDHTSFILLPLVPFYWIWPSGKVLLIAQAAALGLSGWPVFLLARDKLRNETYAAVLAAGFLLQPALGWVNWEQFHPDVFEVPLLLFAIWFMERKRWPWFLACVGAVLLVKEDVPLVTFVLGLYVAARHDRRVGLLTSAVSLLYMAAALWWVLPALNGVGSLNGWRLPFGGPWGVMRTAVAHPAQMIRYLLGPHRPWYVWQLLAPMALLPVLAPSVLVIAIGPLALNLLSNFFYQYDIHYHYTTAILPILAAATVFAVARAPQAARKTLVTLFAVFTVACAYLWGPTPLGIHEMRPAPSDYPTIPYLHAAMAMIPPDAVLSAHYTFVPHVDHRTEIYMFPNPFKASYWGTFKTEGQRLPQADRVQYVLLPSSLDPDPKAVLESIRNEFETVYDQGGIVLMKRKGT